MDIGEIVNNKERSRFEAVFSTGDIAYVSYRWLKGDMVVMHTFVPDVGRGRGIAGELAKFVFAYLKANGLKAIVYCPFILEWVKRHPELADLTVRTAS